MKEKLEEQLKAAEAAQQQHLANVNFYGGAIDTLKKLLNEIENPEIINPIKPEEK